MTVPRLPDRDAAQVDALVADRYLDALLAAGERRADDAPADAALDPDVRHAARVLRRSLVRVHPVVPVRGAPRRPAWRTSPPRRPLRPGRRGWRNRALPFRRRRRLPRGRARRSADPLLDAILRGDLDPADAAAVERAAPAPGTARPLIVGGAAITSAAISIVGVACVAWRASRPDARPGTGLMGRAARSAHARRAAALAGAGLGGPA